MTRSGRLAAVAALLLLAVPAAMAASGMDTYSKHPDPKKFISKVSLLSDTYRVTVNATSLSGQEGWVRVNWEFDGSLAAKLMKSLCVWPSYCSSNDIIALYTPGEGLFTEIAPVKFVWNQLAAPDTWRRGTGNHTFQILNMRQPVQFAYLRGGWFNTNEVVALSPLITFRQSNLPMHARLAVTDTAGQMRVTWTTKDRPPSPTVMWGTSPGKYTGSAQGASWTYTKADMCGAPANGTGWINPGFQTSAVMSKLPADTRIYYKFGDDAAGFGMGSEFSFRTAPAAGGTINILAAADMGHWTPDNSIEWNPQIQPVMAGYNVNPGPGSIFYCAMQNIFTAMAFNGQQGAQYVIKALTDEVATGKYHGFVLNGDISYARGLAPQWEAWHHQLRTVMRSMPSMFSIGNHESNHPGPGQIFNSTDGGGECGVTYQKRFPFPNGSPPGTVGTYYYSFDLGPVHFVQMSSEHAFAAGTPQHAWVKADLDAIDRSKTPWVIVGMHRMPYVDSVVGVDPGSDQLVAMQLRAAYEKMWFDYSVDMVWYGHDHTYQRSCAVYNYSCVPPSKVDGTQQAPIYALFGNAGYQMMPYAFETTTPPIFAAPGGAEAVAYGYVRVQVNATFMRFEAVRASNGNLLDSLVLTKPAGWKPTSPADRAKLRRTLPQGIVTVGTSLAPLEEIMSVGSIRYIISNIGYIIEALSTYFNPQSDICKDLTQLPNAFISVPQWSKPYFLNLVNFLQTVLKPSNAKESLMKKLLNFQENLWTTGRIGQLIDSGNGGLRKPKTSESGNGTH